jgi:hypothetical protein
LLIPLVKKEKKMFSKLSHLLLLPTALRMVLAASNSSSTTACNNSPSLCNRAYNNITHLGAHDSPFVRDASNDYDVSGNQFYNSTVQLEAGVRLLTAQVQTNNGSLHVCHTSCALFDAGTLSSWLSEVNTWLVANPNEVVTVLLVNGADANASDLAAEYQSASISDIAYTRTATSSSSATASATRSSVASSSSTASTSASDWPTLQTLISDGTRMVNFVASLDDNTNATFLLNEWDYIFENNYDNTAPTDFSCVANRPSSVGELIPTSRLKHLHQEGV